MKSQERMKFWRQHIEAQKLRRESVTIYCAREKISIYSFYNWRKRLSTSQRSAVPVVVTPFASVEIMNSTRSKQASESGRRHLPDPKWTAAFVSHLLRGFAP